MGFFDLSIPYHESDRHVADKSTLKVNRLKLAVKAAELGYTGVAYNRVIKGVMSDSDRCSIPLFSLSSLIKLAPALSSSVKFHRDLLNVPVSTPFRQYTRLTVIVDTPAQAAALNSGNPVLKTFDIVAVRPLNQNSFEQACQTAEVDIIAIDFSEKLPFRLKQSMVQAAIKRGVFFEISYSGLIVDAQSRRQMISSAKLLVDWTRRKNLIVSSAAPSASELRGPYDVVNLLFLLGLPFEHAKAAISKNCRSVIAVALRKKHYYKETIKVDLMPSRGNLNSENPVYSDWLNWDPISSGEGDLLLDDIEKFFSATGSVSNNVNTAKFASALNSLPHGLQIKDVIEKSIPEIVDGGKKLSTVQESQVSVTVYGKSAEPCGPSLQPGEGQTAEKIRKQCSSHLDFEIHTLSSSTLHDYTQVEEKSNLASIEESGSLKEFEACFPASDAKLESLHAQSCLDSNTGQVHWTVDVTNISCENDTDTAQTCDNVASEENYVHSKDIIPSSLGTESAMPISSPVGLLEVDISVEEDKSETAPENEKKPPFALSGVSLNERSRDNTHVEEQSVNFVISADVFLGDESHNVIARENESVSEVEPMQEDILEKQREIKDPVTMHCQILGKSVSGRRKAKRRAGYQHFPFHLKRILNLRPFKKKIRKLNRF